ncbi:unnamed protein product, partial [Gordionus sp. m RMFG-2023]
HAKTAIVGRDMSKGIGQHRVPFMTESKETTPKTTGSKINALMGERLLALLERVPSESQLYLQSVAEGLESMSHSNKYFFNCETKFAKNSKNDDMLKRVKESIKTQFKSKDDSILRQYEMCEKNL